MREDDEPGFTESEYGHSSEDSAQESNNNMLLIEGRNAQQYLLPNRQRNDPNAAFDMEGYELVEDSEEGTTD